MKEAIYIDPDFRARHADHQVPVVSSIGRGPRGNSVTAVIVSDEAGRFIFRIVDEFGEVIFESPNLDAGMWSFYQDDVPVEAGIPTIGHFTLLKDGMTEQYMVTIPPGEHGTRIFTYPAQDLKPDGVYVLDINEFGLSNNNPDVIRVADQVMIPLKKIEDDGAVRWFLGLGQINSISPAGVVVVVKAMLEPSEARIPDELIDRLGALETTDAVHEERMGEIEAVNNAQATDIHAVTVKNNEQDLAIAEAKETATTAVELIGQAGTQLIDLGTAMTNLASDVTNIQTAVNNLMLESGDTETAISDLNRDVTAIAQRVSDAESQLLDKQAKLVAGENITITGNVISAAGSSGEVPPDLAAQLEVINDNIALLQSEDLGINAAITNAQGDIINLNSTVGTQAGQITALQSSMPALYPAMGTATNGAMTQAITSTRLQDIMDAICPGWTQ